MAKPGYYSSTVAEWLRLHPKAKAMRRKPTPAEDALWKGLRRGTMGVRFRRQHPIGGYIPDFVCLSRMIAVEVDGPVHDQQADRDGNRDGLLESLGYQVLRFSNERALRDTQAVLAEIGAAIQKRSSVGDTEG